MIMCSVLISYCVCRRPSWKPKTRPNGSSAVVWLSFWFSTRFTREAFDYSTGYFFLPPNFRLSPQKTAIWGDTWNGILWNKVSLLFRVAQVTTSQLWCFIQLCRLQDWSCFFSGLRFKRTWVNFKLSFQYDAKKTSKEVDFWFWTSNKMMP